VNILNQENHAALSPHMATSIALDPFPTQGRHDHPGRVVNGVQVVTCPARTISSRLAAANLTAAGLDDYIVSNFDHNVELAVAKEIRRRWRSFAALARRIADTEFGDPKRDSTCRGEAIPRDVAAMVREARRCLPDLTA
jgi:predicted O-linked N-acetylglucosamine transferase (SPINDLY family)